MTLFKARLPPVVAFLGSMALVSSRLTPTALAQTTVSSGGSGVHILFQTDKWVTPNIHYKAGSGSWTTSPGVAMSASNNSAYLADDGWFQYDIASATSLEFDFNDGVGVVWDNNNNANYKWSPASEILTVGESTLESVANAEDQTITNSYAAAAATSACSPYSSPNILIFIVPPCYTTDCVAGSDSLPCRIWPPIFQTACQRGFQQARRTNSCGLSTLAPKTGLYSFDHKLHAEAVMAKNTLLGIATCSITHSIYCNYLADLPYKIAIPDAFAILLQF